MKNIAFYFLLMMVMPFSWGQLIPAGKTHLLVGCGGDRGNLDGCPRSLPVLAFTDLNSGPDTGLGDGQGSGTIVTVWGYGLGATQGVSKVEYCDSRSVCRDAAHVYYWKNADGVLPGGPANLYESHGMQEIAFSIPDSADGAGTIKVTVNANISNTMPFTVRPGNIYFTHSAGSDRNDCSWANPCKTIDGGYIHPGHANALGNGRMVAGDIVYSRGVTEPGMCGGGICAGLYVRSVVGTEASPVAISSYPGTVGKITSPNWGLKPRRSEAISISKFLMEVGYADPAATPDPGNSAASNFHVTTSEYSRTVGNLMRQIDGTCFTGWSGAVTSGGTGGHRAKIFGNHIKDLGCANSSRFQHTLYMSVRSSSAVTEAWEIGYNYLDNNDVFYGIHNYDETYSGDCGNLTGTLKIHNNVVVNQRGAGINIGTKDKGGAENPCWTTDIEVENNLLVNVGLGVVADDGVTNADAIRITGDIVPTNVTIKNNTVWGYGEASSLANDVGHAVEISFDLANPAIVMENNVYVQNAQHANLSWLSTVETISANNNAFYNTVTGNANTPPAWPGNITANPEITINGAKASLSATSPLIDAGTTAATGHDIYGNVRGTSIGAVED